MDQAQARRRRGRLMLLFDKTPGAQELVGELRLTLAEYFPGASLEIYAVPDMDAPGGGRDEVVAVARWLEGPEVAFDALERFRDAWWLERSGAGVTFVLELLEL